MTIFLMYSKGMSTLASSRVMFSNLLLVERINSEINIYCKEVLENIAYAINQGWARQCFFEIDRIPDIRAFFTGYPAVYRIPDFNTIRPESSFSFLSIFRDNFFSRKTKKLSGGIQDIRLDTGYPAGYRISDFHNINFPARSGQPKHTIWHNPKMYCFVLKE